MRVCHRSIGVPFKSSIQSSRHGFTLVEVAAALGIAAFGFVALVALMGVGLESRRLAQEEVRINQIARSLLSDFSIGSYPEATMIHGSNPSSDESRVTLDLAESETRILLFDQQGNALGSVANTEPTEGSGPGYFYATVQVQPGTDLTDTPGIDWPSGRVRVLVEWPAAREPEQRRTAAFHFASSGRSR